MASTEIKRGTYAAKVLALATSYKDRTKTSIYISEGLYKRFQTVCEREEANASRAIEVFIADFLKDWEKPKSASSTKGVRA